MHHASQPHLPVYNLFRRGESWIGEAHTLQQASWSYQMQGTGPKSSQSRRPSTHHSNSSIGVIRVTEVLVGIFH